MLLSSFLKKTTKTRTFWVLLLLISLLLIAGAPASAADSAYRPIKPSVTEDSIKTVTSVSESSNLAALLNVLCTPDVNGANDAVGQGDLTTLCSGDLVSNQQDFEVSWDDINWTGQTGDACWLFNTDGDEGINYSLCVTVENDGSGGVQLANNPLAYSCNDRTDKPLNCFGRTLINDITATCTVSVTDTDPFYAEAFRPTQDLRLGLERRTQKTQQPNAP